jgi:hypothetical protein
MVGCRQAKRGEEPRRHDAIRFRDRRGGAPDRDALQRRETTGSEETTNDDMVQMIGEGPSAKGLSKRGRQRGR